MMRVWIGWDAREMRAVRVAECSLQRTCSIPLDVRRLALPELRAKGLYWREHREVDGRRWDVVSQAPMSTDHATSRFLVPYLANFEGLALFVDGDVLFLRDVSELVALADPRYAVQVVQHAPMPEQAEKKRGDRQLAYPRKNWSSVMLFHAGHPANRALTPERVNTLPGRDLHRLCWLDDAHIGALPAGWNYLVGVTDPMPEPVSIAHFTLGTPDIPAYDGPGVLEDAWHTVARSAGYRLPRVTHAAV